MAWTYSDWITLTGSARLARLRLHIQEVSDQHTASVSGDGVSISAGGLESMLARLMKEEEKISAQLNATPFSVATRRFD